MSGLRYIQPLNANYFVFKYVNICYEMKRQKFSIKYVMYKLFNTFVLDNMCIVSILRMTIELPTNN